MTMITTSETKRAVSHIYIPVYEINRKSNGSFVVVVVGELRSSL